MVIGEVVAGSPHYAFMEVTGLPPPPGAVLDADNSETERLLTEGIARRPRRPLVLTFRTEASVEQVTAFYGRTDPALRFHARTVPMGGRFQGVQRVVARASGNLRSGREATVTVSRPGVDVASRRLVAETSVRVEIR
ncbi:MAG: hypothetical protein H0V09_09210 [Gemmatimonadetes bacterium]|nr:hypothetical protein [Gemmatimonadota bacterium]